MEAEALNCPNCGAAVASNHVQCEFCKTRLKTVACPSCFGLMFVGTQFCGYCGAKAVQTTIDENTDLGNCPRCRRSLDGLVIGEVKLRECLKCGGMWSDVATFEGICADKERQSAVLGLIDNRKINFDASTKISYVPCPDCKQLMNRSNFAHSSAVIIDVCKKHGVWFDAEELPKIIEFIQKGGMEIARERERMEIRDERDRRRDEHGKQAAFDRRFGLAGVLDDDEHADIRRFIQKLFD